MAPPLTEIEARIVGSLIEKELTTPDYYPMTLNALVNACNQKNNREPVVGYDERTVAAGLEGLRTKGLVSTVTGAGIRTPKYRHAFREVYGTTAEETAIFCLLLLRGAQTPGELRGRSGPLHHFASLEEVNELLTRAEAGGRVVRLPRRTGQKETRFAHLFFGAPPAEAPAEPDEGDRVAKLEEEVRELRTAFTKLEAALERFRKEFE